MGRYIKKFARTLSLGPTEERGFAMWVGYDLAGIEGDLTEAGLINVDALSDEELTKQYGVTAFTAVAPDDEATYEKLGIARS